MLNQKSKFIIFASALMVISPLISHAALNGVGYARHCPEDGYIESVDMVTVHVESWPSGAASGARVV